MKSRLNYALIFLSIVLSILLISSVCIKLDYSQVCVMNSSSNSYSLIVNKKIHNFIEKNNIKKVSATINEHTNYFYISYQDKTDQNFSYWLNATSPSFSVEDGNYSLPFNFGKINFISYIL